MDYPLLPQRVDARQLDIENAYPDKPLPPAYIIEFYEQYNKEMITYVCGMEFRKGRQKSAAVMAICREILKIKVRYNSWECIESTLREHGYILHYGHKVRHLKTSRTFYVIVKMAQANPHIADTASGA